MKSDTPNFFKTYSHLKHASYIVMHDMSWYGPYTYRIYMGVAETQASLRIYTDPPEPSLPVYTMIRCSWRRRIKSKPLLSGCVNMDIFWKDLFILFIYLFIHLFVSAKIFMSWPIQRCLQDLFTERPD